MELAILDEHVSHFLQEPMTVIERAAAIRGTENTCRCCAVGEHETVLVEWAECECPCH